MMTMGAAKNVTPADNGNLIVCTPQQLRDLVRAAVREEVGEQKAAAAASAPEYLTTQQVATMLQTSTRNVRYFVTRKQLAALRVGTEYRFQRDAVMAYMEQREKGDDA